MAGNEQRETPPRRRPGLVQRYLMVVGAILAVVVGGAIAMKSKPGKLKRSVDEAMAAYAEAQAAALGVLEDLSLPSTIEEHDWLVAMSYSAKQADGKTFSCFGAYFVTVCSSPK